MSKLVDSDGKYTVPNSVCGQIEKSEIENALSSLMPALAEFLSKNGDRDEPIVRFRSPDDLRKLFDVALPDAGVGLENLTQYAKDIMNYSVRTGHVRFFNQLWGGCDVSAVIGEWLTAVLNTSMYTYEVSPVFTLMEVEILDRMFDMVGYPRAEADGVFCPGGSNCNLLAMLAARNRLIPGIKEAGFNGQLPAVFTSIHDHYTIKRSSSVIGIGMDHVYKVAVDKEGKMLASDLEAKIEKAKAEGRTPMFLNATCGTTVLGAYDPIEELSAVCKKHNIWLHIDACWGGHCLFSEERKHLMKGCHLADSIALTSTKCLGMPQQCATLLLRYKNILYNCNSMKEDYLFHDSPEKEYDLGEKTLNCGRRVDALKLWVSWKVNGTQGLKARVDHAFSQAEYLVQQLKANSDKFRLVHNPESLNVCFWYIPPSARSMPEGPEKEKKLDEACLLTRRKIQVEGKILVNYSDLPGLGSHFYRAITCNIGATRADIDFMLSEIDRHGVELGL